jgi:hypothetical protein
LFPASLHHDDDHVDGAALRWCINYGEAENIQLCLLSLPQPATATEGRPAFKRDACPGQFLYAEDLFTKLASACRPHNAALPTLFTEDPDQLRDTLETHSGRRYKVIFFIVSKFVSPCISVHLSKSVFVSEINLSVPMRRTLP